MGIKLIACACVCVCCLKIFLLGKTVSDVFEGKDNLSSFANNKIVPTLIETQGNKKPSSKGTAEETNPKFWNQQKRNKFKKKKINYR
jgi:hypothetical protein